MRIKIALLLVILFLSQFGTVSSNTSSTATRINVGTTTGSLTSSEDSMWYIFSATASMDYQISLSADSATDFDLYVYDQNLDSIDSSASYSYPEIVTISVTFDQDIYIEIYAYDGSGSFTLELTEGTSDGNDSGFDNAENIALGSHTGYISGIGDSNYYSINVTNGQDYKIALNGDTYTDFDLFLYNSEGIFVDSSEEYNYPEVISFSASQTGVMYVEVYSYDGTGEYSLNFIKLEPLPNDFTKFNEDGMLIYTLSGGNTINLEIDRLGGFVQAAIVDTDFYPAVLNAIIMIEDDQLNPHLLYDSYFDGYDDNMNNISISYTTSSLDIYLVIYSLDEMLTDTVDQFTGFRISSDTHDITVSVFDEDIDSNLSHQYEGKINENGDYYIDDNEWIVYNDININQGDTVEILLANDYGEYGLILMDGSSADDMNNAIVDINNFISYGYSLPSHIYSFSVSEGVAYISYQTQSDISPNLFIFSNNRNNLNSANYYLYISHEVSGGVGGGEDTTIDGPKLFFAFSGIALISLLRKRYK